MWKVPLDHLGFRNPPKTTRRQCGRLFVAEVACDLGEVQDISGSDMRVLCRAKPTVLEGDGISLKITSPVGDFTAKYRVVRVGKCGLRRWEIGLGVEEATDDARQVMTRIASSVSREMNESFNHDRRAG